jgi:hypothetical protein
MMPAIAARCPDVVPILVGDGPYRRTANLAEQLNVQPRALSRSAQRRARAIGRVGSPRDSHIEGFLLAVVEALALGRPVVGYDVGGMAATEHGRTGELVPARNMDAFVAPSSPCYDLLLDAYSKRALAAAEQFSVTRTSQNFSSATRKQRKQLTLTSRRERPLRTVVVKGMAMVIHGLTASSESQPTPSLDSAGSWTAPVEGLRSYCPQGAPRSPHAWAAAVRCFPRRSSSTSGGGRPRTRAIAPVNAGDTRCIVGGLENLEMAAEIALGGPAGSVSAIPKPPSLNRTRS